MAARKRRKRKPAWRKRLREAWRDGYKVIDYQLQPQCRICEADPCYDATHPNGIFRLSPPARRWPKSLFNLVADHEKEILLILRKHSEQAQPSKRNSRANRVLTLPDRP